MSEAPGHCLDFAPTCRTGELVAVEVEALVVRPFCLCCSGFSPPPDHRMVQNRRRELCGSFVICTADGIAVPRSSVRNIPDVVVDPRNGHIHRLVPL